LTRLRHPAPKDWADSYLAAFAGVAQLTLVTFDRAMRGKVKPIVLLGDQGFTATSSLLTCPRTPAESP
jgi:hypothetical protein